MLGISNSIVFRYLIDQRADVYIPVTNRILLYTGEFETKVMFCTFSYFNRAVHNMLLFLTADWIAGVST
jgi:hypothetical protein